MIETMHPQYQALRPVWDAIDVALQGQHAVKAARTRYLKPTAGMQAAIDSGISAPYDAYLHRARFPDIAADALEGALGVLFAREPIGGEPPGVPVTIDGLDTIALARETSRHVFSKGRHILVVTAPIDGGEPYIAQYRAESLINWKTDIRGNLTLAVFAEPVPRGDIYAVGDIYTHETEIQHRVYTNDGVRVYDKHGNVIEQYNLPRGWRGIPIVTIGAVDNNADCDRAPIDRIVHCALSAYQLSADYYQALYLTAQATPWVNGITDEQFKQIQASGIGAGAMWHLGDAGKTGFLEFNGAGVESIKTAILDELNQAAQYSIKLVEQGKWVESAEAKGIRDRAQKSSLQTLADSVSVGISKALEIRARIAGRQIPEPFVLQIEEMKEQPNPSMIQALGAQANAGNIPPVSIYNYAVSVGLFVGSYDEWQAQLQGAVV